MSLLVGNETLLRKDVSMQQLVTYLREVRARTWRPVSTSETWNTWLAHPELAKEVDYLGVHILPYWEGLSVDEAVDYVFDRYRALRKRFPGKPIVITEVGWPSDGQSFKHAVASRTNQAKFLREFLSRATKEKLIYYIVEAFDQPWKMAIEGSAGAYWGIFNADRQQKYPLDGRIFALPTWKNWATGAAVFSAVLMILFLYTRRSLNLLNMLFFGLMANLAASAIFWTLSISAQQYQTGLTLVFWIILILMQLLA
ncbi:MAG: glycoside hydrolase family 17 protein [Gammaproteobacteria bacterium]